MLYHHTGRSTEGYTRVSIWNPHIYICVSISVCPYGMHAQKDFTNKVHRSLEATALLMNTRSYVSSIWTALRETSIQTWQECSPECVLSVYREKTSPLSSVEKVTAQNADGSYVAATDTITSEGGWWQMILTLFQNKTTPRRFFSLSLFCHWFLPLPKSYHNLSSEETQAQTDFVTRSDPTWGRNAVSKLRSPKSKVNF